MKAIYCDNLQIIGEKIRQAEARFGREPNSVQLLAVSKRHPASAIQECLECGQIAFGENYAQELIGKAKEIEDNKVSWHYIGPIQSNKTRLIAESAQWVHSIDRLKIARRLSEQMPEGQPPINVCIQLNISAEKTKSGIALDELKVLADQIVQLPNLTLKGIMAIPAAETDFDKQRYAFAKARKALEALNIQGYELDTLSMGMSGDMEAAIAEGATIVRIGTAIFGKR